MERHLDDELKKLNTDLLKMATLTEEAISKAIAALTKQDIKLAEETIIADKKIDELENKIEEESIEILALFQPMAKDLRFITTAMCMKTGLEEIADLTVNICQRVKEIADKPVLKPLSDIPPLADNAKKMVKNAIDAFVNHDDKLARQVVLSDQVSNNLRNTIIHELIADYMVKDGKTAPRAIPILLVARDLERISDYAASMAEDIIYMIHAKMVKHHPEMLKNDS